MRPVATVSSEVGLGLASFFGGMMGDGRSEDAGVSQ